MLTFTGAAHDSPSNQKTREFRIAGFSDRLNSKLIATLLIAVAQAITVARWFLRLSDLLGRLWWPIVILLAEGTHGADRADGQSHGH